MLNRVLFGRRVIHLVGLASVGLMLAACEETEQASPGILPDSLTVTEMREGAAGFTGTRWIIEPGGTWHRQTMVNESTTSEVAVGQLESHGLTCVVRALKHRDFVGIPPTIDQAPPIDRHLFVLEMGEHSTWLALAPLHELSEARKQVAEEHPIARFIDIIRAVRAALANDPCPLKEVP